MIVFYVAEAAVLITAVVLFLRWASVKHAGLFWVRHAHNAKLKAITCPRCKGMGVRWLEGGRKQPIPERIGDERGPIPARRARVMTYLRLANTGRCDLCHGKENILVPADEDNED